MKNYCAYIPWKVVNNDDVEYIKSINAQSQKIYYNRIYSAFKPYLLNDDDLDINLAIIKKFLTDENAITLTMFEDKIELILINQYGYRPKDILSIISDMDHNQCFIAVTTNWINLENVEDKIEFIKNKYNINIQRIFSSMDFSFGKILNHLNSDLSLFYPNKKNYNNTDTSVTNTFVRKRRTNDIKINKEFNTFINKKDPA